jgi:hypothetical protein
MAFKFSDRGPSYQDAVWLLGHDEPKIIKIVERLGGAALVSVSAGSLSALALFDVRDGLMKWGIDVVRTIRDRISGLSRFDRTQRLVAAHTVIVITSFYEALGEMLDGSAAPIRTRIRASSPGRLHRDQPDRRGRPGPHSHGRCRAEARAVQRA